MQYEHTDYNHFNFQANRSMGKKFQKNISGELSARNFTRLYSGEIFPRQF